MREWNIWQHMSRITGTTHVAAAMVCLLLLMSSEAFAETYYVDAGMPNDTGDGSSWLQAEKTIGAGIAHLQSGDTLKIKTGIYAESISVIGKSFSSWTTIETDDGAGNPGAVTLQPGANATTCFLSHPCAGGKVIIYVYQSTYVKIDGRQKNGFNAVSDSHIEEPVLFDGDDTATYDHAILQHVTVSGNASSGVNNNAHIAMYNYQHSVIAYCRSSLTAGSEEAVIDLYKGTGSNSMSDNEIHHCEILNAQHGGYAGISIRRMTGTKIYNNCITGFDPRNWDGAACGIRYRGFTEGGSPPNQIYNNIIYIEPSKYAYGGIQLRGSSSYPNCDGGVMNAEVYNNTIICDGGFSKSFLMLADRSDNNKFYDNLMIGSGIVMESLYWEPSNGECGSYTSNELYGNVVTGDATWFANADMKASFDVDSGNLENQGTGNIPADIRSCEYVLETWIGCSAADMNSDGSVSLTELMGYVSSWKSGSVTLTALMSAIAEWKNGC